MNILVRGVDSLRGYQTQILNNIWEKIQCDKCIIISRNNDNHDKYPESKYVDIPCIEATHGCKNEMQHLDSVPEDVLLGMQRYEGRIYETMIRECLMPVFTFEECKSRYYSELLYWYHIIKKHDIDYMIFHNAPHFTHDYVIYCLGTVLQIPMLLFMPTFFPGRLEWGTRYENLGLSVGDRYKTLVKENEDVHLPEDLEDIYNKYRRGFDKEELGKVIKKNKDMFENLKHYRTYTNRNVAWDRRMAIIGKMIRSNSLEEKKIFVKEYLRDIDLTKRCKKYLKSTVNVFEWRGYEHLSDKALKQKYIYFGLQANPESGLMPKLDVFYEQKHMILILAKAAEKCGLKLYIKEHWVQPVREKELYEFIRQFKNVHLFGPNESNIQLMKNSFAVATGTGSSIMEGMFNNIPALTFGDGFWNGAPGVYRIHSQEDCIKAINEIKEKKFEITDNMIRCYLQAVAEETVPMNLFQNIKLGSPFSDDESIKNISEFIIKWIENENKKRTSPES